MDRKGDARKCSGYVLRRDPVGRGLGVVIVTVDRQAVASDEVLTVTVGRKARRARTSFSMAVIASKAVGSG